MTESEIHGLVIFAIAPLQFICDCMDVMVGADSDNQSQTSDQP